MGRSNPLRDAGIALFVFLMLISFEFKTTGQEPTLEAAERSGSVTAPVTVPVAFAGGSAAAVQAVHPSGSCEEFVFEIHRVEHPEPAEATGQRAISVRTERSTKILCPQT
jgi:hypothetical protein